MHTIQAISVARIGCLSSAQGRDVYSAIQKRPLSTIEHPEPIGLGRLGFVGDEHADTRVHGGPDKAVYAYPFEHYVHWQRWLSDETGNTVLFDCGQFGENLTVMGFDESEVYVGDRWQIRETILEVVKHREPCFKFNIHMGSRFAAKWMLSSGYCGWYLRVIREGYLAAGDGIVITPGARCTSIRQLNDALSSTQSSLF